MSGLFHLAWIAADGQRGHTVTGLPREIAEKLRARCAADLSEARYFVIAEEDIETWKAQ